jgi:hypothetical protein
MLLYRLIGYLLVLDTAFRLVASFHMLLYRLIGYLLVALVSVKGDSPLGESKQEEVHRAMLIKRFEGLVSNLRKSIPQLSTEQ